MSGNLPRTAAELQLPTYTSLTSDVASGRVPKSDGDGTFSDATTAHVPDSTDKRYCTDAQKTDLDALRGQISVDTGTVQIEDHSTETPDASLQILGTVRNPATPEYGRYATLFKYGNPGFYSNGPLVLNGVPTLVGVDGKSRIGDLQFRHSGGAAYTKQSTIALGPDIGPGEPTILSLVQAAQDIWQNYPADDTLNNDTANLRIDGYAHAWFGGGIECGMEPLALSATRGFCGLPITHGKPTAVPEDDRAGNMVWDDVNKKVWVFDLVWRAIEPTAATLPATGGDSIIRFGEYLVHVFTSSGTFTPTAETTVSYLVVGGGGGGGSHFGGGGGGGDVLSGTTVLAAGVGVAVTVGGGGAPDTAGSNSSLGAVVTALGGGKGGKFVNGGDCRGGDGASGGGGSIGNAAGTSTQAEGGAATGAGYAGGTGYQGSTHTYCVAAGGGGAGGVGGSPTPNSSVAGNGGIGITSSITGTDTGYGGGGGGSVAGALGTPGTASHGGGGGACEIRVSPQSGTNGTGGGGGGGLSGYGVTAGSGGSGVVIIRYTASA